MDDKLNLFFDKDLLQQTVNACVDKGISLAEVRWFTQPENRITLAKQLLAGQYHIAPPHIIEIPKRDSAEMRKVYCNEAMDASSAHRWAGYMNGCTMTGFIPAVFPTSMALAWARSCGKSPPSSPRIPV